MPETAARAPNRPGFELVIVVDGKVDMGPFRQRIAEMRHVSFVEESYLVFRCGHGTLRNLQKLLHRYVSS